MFSNNIKDFSNGEINLEAGRNDLVAIQGKRIEILTSHFSEMTSLMSLTNSRLLEFAI